MNSAARAVAWLDIQTALEEHLPDFLVRQRWYGGKTRVIHAVQIADVLPVPGEGLAAAFLIARVVYEDGGTEAYNLPLVDEVSAPADATPAASVLKIRAPDGKDHSFSDALQHRAFLARLFEGLAEGHCFAGSAGEVRGSPTRHLPSLRRSASSLEPALMKAEQSNTSVLYGRTFVLKLFRHVEEGVNPDLEIGEFLSDRIGFRNIPPVAGSFEYRRPGRPAATVGILQGFVSNRGDAWQQTLVSLEHYYERVEKHRQGTGPDRGTSDASLVGDYLASARLLGQRTAELHVALSSDSSDANFAPEPFLVDDQRAISGAMAHLAVETFELLRRRTEDLRGSLAKRAEDVLGLKDKALEYMRRFGERPLGGLRIRIHGDLHLGQILASDDDFIFIDFEGEPARSLAERRAKYSPIRDVAGMLRSFHYAAYAALFRHVGESSAGSPVFAQLSPFASAWYDDVSRTFLDAYLQTGAASSFLPEHRDEFNWSLRVWLLDKAIYELKYELNHRLDWVAIPLEGIYALLTSG